MGMAFFVAFIIAIAAMNQSASAGPAITWTTGIIIFILVFIVGIFLDFINIENKKNRFK